MTQTTISQLVIDALRASSIERLYCIPGVQNDDFFNVLFDAPDIAPVVTRHEQGAAYMALGAAQVTGKPAAFCVVPGPGMLNASAALTSGYWAYARVLAVIGQINTDLMGFGGGALHELRDQTAILSQLTKHTVSLREGQHAAALVQEAVDALHGGVPRPVSLEVPANVWSELADGSIIAPSPSPPAIDPSIIERAAETLDGAQRPLIVVGSGAYGASEEIIALAEQLQIPVTTRRQGHGVMPTGHPLFVPLTVGYKLWEHADVVLGIGSRLEWPMGTWGYDNDLQLITINIDSDELDRYGVGAIGIHGDAAEAASALASACGRAERPELLADAQRHREWFAEATEHLVPQRSYTAAIREAMPDDGVLVEDVTQIGFASHLFYDHLAPRTFLTSGAAGTLGAGTAVAIGAADATDKPVVGIIGDGGFLFTATELATAAQYDIPCNILLFNNNSYGNVKRIQALRFGAERTIASTLQNPDFAKLADAFGVRYWHTDTPEGVTKALSESIDHQGPSLVEVSVDPMPNPWPFLRMAPLRGPKT